MSVYIFIMLIVAACLSRSLTLLISGVIYSALSMLHYVTFARMGGDVYGYYYATAGLFDVICVGCICLASKAIGRDSYLFPLSIVILLSIVNNLIGLFFWYFYINPQAYSVFALLIYFTAALILIGSRYNVGRILRFNKSILFHSVSNSNGLHLDCQEQIRCRTE